MTKEWKISICGVCLFAAVLLAYGLLGRPPYSYFSLMRVTVAIATGLGAWAVYKTRKWFLPLSLGLVLIGGVHLFGRMRRFEWESYNWAAIAALVIAVLVVLAFPIRKDSR
jgi:TctA family transporter